MYRNSFTTLQRFPRRIRLVVRGFKAKATVFFFTSVEIRSHAPWPCDGRTNTADNSFSKAIVKNHPCRRRCLDLTLGGDTSCMRWRICESSSEQCWELKMKKRRHDIKKGVPRGVLVIWPLLWVEVALRDHDMHSRCSRLLHKLESLLHFSDEWSCGTVIDESCITPWPSKILSSQVRAGVANKHRMSACTSHRPGQVSMVNWCVHTQC
jgi:hypothetical protein